MSVPSPVSFASAVADTSAHPAVRRVEAALETRARLAEPAALSAWRAIVGGRLPRNRAFEVEIRAAGTSREDALDRLEDALVAFGEPTDADIERAARALAEEFAADIGLGMGLVEFADLARVALRAGNNTPAPGDEDAPA